MRVTLWKSFYFFEVFVILAFDPRDAALRRAMPMFHLVPYEFGSTADINGPFFDPIWSMYHIFYQHYFSECNCMAWGHLASRDLISWSQLPPALLPNDWFDKSDIYSGHAFVLDDESKTPVLSVTGKIGVGVFRIFLAKPRHRFTDPYLRESLSI